MIAVLIEHDDCRLGGNAVLVHPGLFDGAQILLAGVDIRGFEQNLIICKLEVVVQEREPEALKAVVSCKDLANFLQAIRVSLVDGANVGDVAKIAPLHGGDM
jgi:hypothetical protein